MNPCALAEAPPVEQLDLDETVLGSRGWQLFDFRSISASALTSVLLSLAGRLGVPTPTRVGGGPGDLLSPIKTEKAKPRSLSKLHEEGEFPLHIDTAHWPTPCRYLLIACFSPGSGGRPTYLLDTRRLSLREDQTKLLQSAPLRVTNGRYSFFTTILSRTRPFVRVDPGCMTPTSADGAAALAVLSRENWLSQIETVQWRAGMVLALDNWRTLHGRGRADRRDCDRKLLRISIR
jgi:hypothetical protein